MVSPDTADDVLHEARKFLAGFGSLQIATASSSGEPVASYAPFALLGNGNLGLLLSGLAAHTGNLQQNPRASVMLIEAERDAGDIFARRRLVLQCEARLHPAGSAVRDEIASALQKKHGETAAQIAKLADFQGVELIVQSASYVAGFARAHSLTADALFASR